MKDLSKMAMPKVITVVGEIVTVKDVVGVNTSKLVSIQDANGNDHQVWFGDNQIHQMKMTEMFIGNVVSVSAEQRIENETEYLNDEGNIEYHKSTGLNAISISNAGRIAIIAMLRNSGYGYDDACKFFNELEARRNSMEVSGKIFFRKSISNDSKEQIEKTIEILTRKMNASKIPTIKETYAKKIEELNVQLEH